MMTYLVIDADQVVELPEVRFWIDLQNISFAGVDSAPIELKTGSKRFITVTPCCNDC